MLTQDTLEKLYADKDLSLLKKLTLIIPTHNRNFYLSRCLWYHAHFPFDEIIVADSSVEEKRVVNRETVQKIRDMFGAHITYLKYNYPAEEYGGEIYQKWGDSVQHSVTEYTEFCTDKEFLVPTEISAFIQFLIDHPDYVTAEGRVYQIRGYPKGTREYNPWQDVPSVISDDPHERLYTALERTTGTLFSVYHTNILK